MGTEKQPEQGEEVRSSRSLENLVHFWIFKFLNLDFRVLIQHDTSFHGIVHHSLGRVWWWSGRTDQG